VPCSLQFLSDRHRDVQPKWPLAHDPVDAGRVPALPKNDNHEGGGRCPACNLPLSIAPVRSNYCRNGRIDHIWHCGKCDYEWTTTLRVSS